MTRTRKPVKSTILQFVNQFIRLLTHLSSLKQDEEPPPDKEEKKEEEPLCLLSQLPTEIILLIFDELSLPTQACLALTCKILYEDLGYILRDKRLSLSPAWACKSAELPLSQPTLLRNQFLFNAEDDRWLYCSGCLRLHPRYLFTSWEQARPSAKRRCQHEGRVLDICPCLVFTYFEGQQLEQWARTGNPNEYTPERIRRAFTPMTTDKTILHHRCSITDHTEALADITTTALIGDSGFLELHSSYHVHLNLGHAAIDEVSESYKYFIITEQLEPIFLCPHLDILKIIFGWHPLESKACWICATIAEIPDWIDDEMHVIFQGVRSLGDIEKPRSYTWNSMCRNEYHERLRQWYNNPGDQASLS